MSSTRPLFRRPSDIAREGWRQPRGKGDWSSAGRPGNVAWPQGFAGTAADRRALLVLMGLAALTPRRLLELSTEAPTASACLQAVRSGRAGSEGDRAYAASIDAGDVEAAVRRAGARLVTVDDPEYPPGLFDLFDPPAGVFVVGRELSELLPGVAIVGARTCSDTGREVAALLAKALARAGVCVVSGGARGIDAAGHQGALAADGTTLAVLGCGVDRPYPRQNVKLLARIPERGAVVSEYPPGTRAEPFRFPARNRLVAALSMGVVVVEGAKGSGSMITAEHAMELGREVFGVPGLVTNPLTWAPHELIRDGAGLIRGPEDLFRDLGLAGGEATEPASPGPSVVASLPADERSVWDALLAPSTADVLASAVGSSSPRVMAVLVGLELRGLVRQVGGRWERTMVR